VSPIARLLASASTLSAWIVLLFLGHPLKGATHLLVVAALLLVPRPGRTSADR
jgi:hypothetical protein